MDVDGESDADQSGSEQMTASMASGLSSLAISAGTSYSGSRGADPSSAAAAAASLQQQPAEQPAAGAADSDTELEGGSAMPDHACVPYDGDFTRSGWRGALCGCASAAPCERSSSTCGEHGTCGQAGASASSVLALDEHCNRCTAWCMSLATGAAQRQLIQRVSGQRIMQPAFARMSAAGLVGEEGKLGSGKACGLGSTCVDQTCAWLLPWLHVSRFKHLSAY